MNICSLVPGATEVVAALGLADRLVGISHECDHPSSIRHAAILIKPMIDDAVRSSRDIDRQVKTAIAEKRPLYRLDERAFRAARPDVILTQDLCHVCAVTPDQLGSAIQALPNRPRVVTLNPKTIEDVVRDVERIAEAVEALPSGRQMARSLRNRLDAVRTRTAKTTPRPRVACLEWLDPLYVAGHWVPEMVRLAGGQDVLGQAGRPSHEITWEEVEAAKPDLLLVMPCGYSIDRTMRELAKPEPTSIEWARALARWPKTFVVDAAAYFSRPGPRLVDGVEWLADLLCADCSVPPDPSHARLLSAAALTAGTAS